MPITKEAIPSGWLKYCEQVFSVCEMLGIEPDFHVCHDNGRSSWLKFMNTGDSETSAAVLDALRVDLATATKLTCMKCGNFSRPRFCSKECEDGYSS